MHPIPPAFGLTTLRYRLVRGYFIETGALEHYDPFASQKLDTFRKSSNGVYRLFLLRSRRNCHAHTRRRARIEYARNRDREGQDKIRSCQTVSFIQGDDPDVPLVCLRPSTTLNIRPTLLQGERDRPFSLDSHDRGGH